MRANELRIGNWVLEGKVCALDNESAWIHTGTTIIPIIFNDCDPIPLTEEWLKKLSFREYDRNGTFVKFAIPFKGEFTHTILVSEGRIVYPNRYEPIVLNSVHQLQNLYFALTGEELKLQEI